MGKKSNDYEADFKGKPPLTYFLQMSPFGERSKLTMSPFSYWTLPCIALCQCVQAEIGRCKNWSRSASHPYGQDTRGMANIFFSQHLEFEISATEEYMEN